MPVSLFEARAFYDLSSFQRIKKKMKNQLLFTFFLLFGTVFSQYGAVEEWFFGDLCDGDSSNEISVQKLDACIDDSIWTCESNSVLARQEYEVNSSTCLVADGAASRQTEGDCEGILGLGNLVKQCSGELPGANSDTLVLTTYENLDCTGNVTERTIFNPTPCAYNLLYYQRAYCSNGNPVLEYYDDSDCTNASSYSPPSNLTSCDTAYGTIYTCGAPGPVLAFGGASTLFVSIPLLLTTFFSLFF